MIVHLKIRHSASLETGSTVYLRIFQLERQVFTVEE